MLEERTTRRSVYLRFVYWGLVVGVLNVAVYILCALIHRGDKFHGTRIGSDFVSGLVGGALLYALLYVALWEWAEQDRIWDVVSFGPPLFLIVLLLAVTVQVGLRDRHRIGRRPRVAREHGGMAADQRALLGRPLRHLILWTLGMGTFG